MIKTQHDITPNTGYQHYIYDACLAHAVASHSQEHQEQQKYVLTQLFSAPMNQKSVIHGSIIRSHVSHTDGHIT